MAVCGDGSYILVVVVGGAETKVIAYKLTKNTGPWVVKAVCSLDFHPSQHISKCSFHPTDKTMVLIMGPGFLQQYFITEDQFLPQDLPYTNLPRPLPHLHFTDFDFTDDY